MGSGAATPSNELGRELRLAPVPNLRPGARLELDPLVGRSKVDDDNADMRLSMSDCRLFAEPDELTVELLRLMRGCDLLDI